MRTGRSTAPMRTAKTGYILAALLMIGLGCFLAVRPETGAAAAGTAAGILLVCFGIVKLIGYFSGDLYRLAFQFDLAGGLLLLVLGTVILTKPEHLLHFLCIAAGLCVTADGLLKLQTAADARRFGIRKWWLLLGAALLTCVPGVLLLLNPGRSTELLMRLLGVVLAAEGVLSLLTVLMTVKIIRHQQPDIIETTLAESQKG